MELLPKLQSDFSSVKYWEKFFAKRTKHFEWYGNYLELCGILHRYIKEKDDILVIGCGNSNLSEQLYDTGFRKIVNIDISRTVIKQMQNKNHNRDEMQWIEMDVTDLKLEDSSHSVVLDKGTLDAMMSDSSDDVNRTIDRMFDEISRVLRMGGRYICISLSQDHILKKILDYFPSNSWLLRIHKVWTDLADNTSQLPVFAFVVTKFKNLPQKIFEICLEDGTKPTRLNNETEVFDFVKTQQYYAMVRGELSRDCVTDEIPPITLFSSVNASEPRYTIHVVELKSYKTNQIYGIFIVPNGREMEWLFNSQEGRMKVAESAKFKRLALVSLNRDHTYDGGMSQIQKELSSKVMELAPANIPSSYKVPFLSVGGDSSIGERHVMYRSVSAITGPFVVEDFVGEQGHWFRQLLFQSNLVQTVVKLKRPPNSKNTKRTKRNQSSKTASSNLVIDPSYFTSQYIKLVMAGLAGVIAEQISALICQNRHISWLWDEENNKLGHNIWTAASLIPRSSCSNSLKDDFRLLVLGLGGGSVVLNLLHVFEKCHITAVEIDPALVDVAKVWFGLGRKDYEERLDIHADDGIAFVSPLAIKNRSSEEKRQLFDVVFVDVDSKDEGLSLRAPPLAFIDPSFLTDVSAILTDKGVMMMNVVSRQQSAKDELIKQVKAHFSTIYKGDCSSDVNEVLLCHKTPANENTDVTTAWRQRAKTWEHQHKNIDLDLCSILNDVVKIS